ncbi:MAG: FeoB-associated Cys-rich membrane protein [Armatimonadota bacterium]|nr:FeoB-associated Cys-rich membrane protein [Armatimonadota bacterium]
MGQDVIAALIVVGAVVWLARTIVSRVRRGGCTCDNAASCPLAGGDSCPLGSLQGFCDVEDGRGDD